MNFQPFIFSCFSNKNIKNCGVTEKLSDITRICFFNNKYIISKFKNLHRKFMLSSKIFMYNSCNKAVSAFVSVIRWI